MKVKQLTWRDILEVDVPLEDNIIVENKAAPEEWDKYLDLFESSTIFGLDLETHGEEEYSALYFRFGLIRLISVSIKVEVREKEFKYYALIYDLGGNLDDIEKKREEFLSSRFYRLLKIKCEDINVPVVGQNLKFDGGFLLYHFDIQLLNCRDLMLCSQVLWAGIEVISTKEKTISGSSRVKARSDRCLLGHSLKAITERVNILFSTTFTVDKTEQKEDWGWRISNSKYNYSGKDSVLPLQLYPYIQDLVVRDNLYYSVMAECLALSAFIQMEVYGFPIDNNLLETNIALCKTKFEQYNKIITDSFPGINWGQVELLRQAFNTKWPELSLGSMNDEALKSVQYPEAEALLRMRTLNVLINYMEGINNTSWKNKNENFYSVRTIYNQISASGSGRSSCTGTLSFKNSKGSRKKVDIGTQLQNPAKTPSWFKDEGLPAFRTFFAAPDNYFLGIIDLSASHYRICTELSQDPVLLDIYLNDKDAHLIMAHTIIKLNGSSVSFDEFQRLYKEEKDTQVDSYRKWGKIANYSGLNQAGAYKLQQTFKGWGVDITLDQAKLIKKAYKETYKRLDQFIQNYIKESNSYNIQFPFYNLYGQPTEGVYGKCKTFTNRTVHLKKQEKISDWGTKFEIPYTESISLIWLCGEADILKFAQGRILIEFYKNPHWKARFCSNCHDELNWIGLRKYSYEINSCVMRILHQELGYWIKSIPVDVDFDPNHLTFTNWNEKK
jgi:DNA polymerase I-like protein with 3'-5' exonuclease and polymerase domains